MRWKIAKSKQARIERHEKRKSSLGDAKKQKKIRYPLKYATRIQIFQDHPPAFLLSARERHRIITEGDEGEWRRR